MTTPANDATCISVCQGPPRCELEGDAAIAAQIAGCPWCTRITVADDGTEQTEAPGNA